MKNSSLTLIAVFGIYLLFCLPASYAGNGNKGNHHSRISVTISPTASSLQPGQSQQFADYGLQSIDANLVQANLGLDGSGVGVAVIDSGVALKNDLRAANGTTSRVVYSSRQPSWL